MASMNSWAFDIGTIVFSIIETKARAELSKDYPNITFTSTDLPKDASIKYPTIYIHDLSGSEEATDLENSEINAINKSIQIDVVTDKSQYDARKVMSALADILKGMQFTIYAMPEFQNDTTTYRAIMRASRRIGKFDSL